MDGIPEIRILQISGFIGLFGYPIAGYGMFACPMTQTRHGVCYLSRKPGRYPSESNKILIFYLTRRVLELTQQPQPSWNYRIMTTRFSDTGLFACRITQARHGVCYLNGKPGRYPSESNKILIFYLTRRVLELTQQPQLGWGC